MDLLLGKSCLDKIMASKKLLISELVDEFGTQYEDLLNERFDKTKFFIFFSLVDMKRYLLARYSSEVANRVIELFNSNGLFNSLYVSDSVKHVCGYTIESSDEEDLFYSVFDTRFLGFSFEYKQKNVFGIFSFNPDLDYDYLNSCAQNRNITTEELLRNNRCDFLRAIGKYPDNYSNDMICNDGNYPILCHYYEELMKSIMILLVKLN